MLCDFTVMCYSYCRVFFKSDYEDNLNLLSFN